MGIWGMPCNDQGGLQIGGQKYVWAAASHQSLHCSYGKCGQLCVWGEGGREGGMHFPPWGGGADNQVSQKESHLVQRGSGIHPRHFLLLRILSSSTSGRPRILGVTCTFDRGEYAGVTCF